MKIFVDSADIDEIRPLAETGLIDGVTTNPSLVAKVGRPIREVIADIHARYFGTELNDRSLTPGERPRLGPTGFDDWLTRASAQ